MKKYWSIFVGALIVLSMLVSLSLAGCTTTTTEETTAETTVAETAAETTVAETAATSVETTAAEETTGGQFTPLADLNGNGMTFGLYVNNLSNPFFADAVAGAEVAAKKWNVDLIIGASGGGVDQADQVRWLEDWIQKGVDVMGTCPPDPSGTEPVIAKSVEAGIPFITFADDAANSKRSVFISNDQYETGKLQAEGIVSAINGQGKVAIIEGIPGNTSNEDRKKGISDVLSQYPKITVTRTVAANFDQAQGLTAAEDILTADPDISVIMCISDTMALGAVQAVKSAGKLDQVKVVGMAGSPDAIISMKNGELEGTIVMNSYLMGYHSVEWAVRLYMGDTPPNPPFVPIPQQYVDKLLVQNIAKVILK